MTLARPHKTVLNLIWQGMSFVGRFCRLAHQRVQARKQARCMAQATITVTAQPIAPHLQPQPQPIELDTLTPTEQETLQVSEQVSCQMAEPSHSSHKTTEDNPAQSTQHQMSRSELVMALLDEAWARGITTYPQLIGYVAEQSGTGCSKRVVANWKRQRGLLDEAA